MSRQCAHCQTYYDERSNVGRWHCRIHPVDGRIRDAKPPALSCCGWSPALSMFAGVGLDTQRGCRLADHDVSADAPPAFVRAYVREAMLVERAAIVATVTDEGALEAVMRRYLPRGADARKVAQSTAATLLHEAYRDPRFYTWYAHDPTSGQALTILLTAAAMWQAKHRRGLLVTPPPTTIEAAIAAYRAPDVPGAEEILNDLAQGMIATKLVPFVDLLVVARVAHDTDTLTALELASSKHALDPLRVGDFGRSAPHSCLFYT